MDITLFNKYTLQVKKRGCWRDEFLEEFLQETNLSRKGTKWKPVSMAYMASKVSHLKETSDLCYLRSICRDAKARGGSYSKVLWGAIKV